MKKRSLYFFVIVLIIGILLVPQSLIFAQTAQPTRTPDAALTTPAASTSYQVVNAAPTPSPEQLAKGENITFGTLGWADNTLYGPYDSMYMSIGIPSSWKLTPEAVIVLDIRVDITRLQSTTGKSGLWAGPSLDIYFDGVYIATRHIQDSGDYQFKMGIPVFELPVSRDSVHNLYIYMDAALDCDYDQSTSLTIKSTSYLNLTHIDAAINADLSQLPNPIYQRSSFLPMQAYMVVPDQPDNSEIQAALTVAAGFGRMAGNALTLNTITVSQLTDEIKKSSHLIFVGKAQSLPILKTMGLPAKTDGTSYTIAGLSADDGVLQINASDWNPTKAVLLVSGSSDLGITKAAQALSSGSIRTVVDPKVVTVSDVKASIESQTTAPVDRTMATLGYKNVNMTGIGTHTADYLFFLPIGYKVSDEAYLDLYITSSELLSLDRSSIAVVLNGNRIKDVSYMANTKETTVQPTHVLLPSYAFINGINRLSIQATHAIDHCAYNTAASLWTTVLANSLLHTPKSALAPSAPAYPSLGIYPEPFVTSPELSELAFVVAPNSTALNVAAKLAQDLGSSTVSDIITLAAFSGTSSAEAAKLDKNLIVVGKPSDLSIISDLGAAMPAPFDAGSNFANETNMRVVYRMPSDANVGYLELMPAPWNTSRVILSVLGSTDTGLSWSGNALLDATLRTTIGGDYAVTNGTKVFSVDTTVGNGTGNASAVVVPEVTQTVQTVTPAATTVSGVVPVSMQTEGSSSQASDPKVWIPYAIIALSVITVLLIIIIAIMGIKRSHDNKYRIDR
jgi:hypothetical protein